MEGFLEKTLDRKSAGVSFTKNPVYDWIPDQVRNDIVEVRNDF